MSGSIISILSALSLSLQAIAPPSQHLDVPLLFDQATRQISRTGLVQRAASADFVLIGETHDSRCDHLAQARILDALAEAGLARALGLEMVGVDEEEVLRIFSEGRIAPPELGQALLWDQNWGVPYSFYQPIFEVAAHQQLPVVGLNLPPGIARLISQRDLPLDRIHPRALLPPRVIGPPAGQLRSLEESFAAHGAPRQGGSLRHRREPFERFVLVQSLWDSKMAFESLAAAQTYGTPVVILAGAGHVEHGWGIAHRLTTLAPGTRVLAILPAREPPAANAPVGGDLFYYCPPEPGPAPGPPGRR